MSAASAASALGYLVLAGARGRLRQLVRRIRSPRHFLGMLLGAGWLAFVVCTNRRAMSPALDAGNPFERVDVAWLGELAALAVLGLGAILSWVIGSDGGGLGFTDAEIHALFPAPLSRRQLVAYKLGQAALGMLVPVVVVAALFGRGAGAGRVTAALGGWLAFMTASLHGVGASLTRAALAQHGVAALRRRLLTLGVAALAPLAAVVGWRRAPPLDAFPDGVAGFAEWTRAVAETAPLSWALYPIRAALDAAFAPSPAAFWAALPGALAMLALHLAWVMSSDAAFEDAAVESARKLSRRLEAMRAGAIPLAGRRSLRRSSALRVDGRPEVALAWRAVVRARRVVSIPVVASAGGVAAVLATVGLVTGSGGPDREMLAVFSAMFFAMAVIAGPAVFSGDLRRDGAHLELLRALPLRGREVLVGEMAVPFAQSAAVQAVFVIVWLATTPFPARAADRVAVALAMLVAGPAISAVTYLVANGAAVLFPDWAAGPAGGPAPLERFGPRNVVGVATAFVSMVALAPAALAAGLVGFALGPALGAWAAPAAALAGAAVVAALGAAALRALGRAFERIDLAA